MINFIKNIFDFTQSHQFLFIIMFASFTIKLFLLGVLIPLGIKKQTVQYSWFFLIGTLVGVLFGDIAWILKLGRTLFIPKMSYKIVTFFIRIAWALLIVQYQSLALLTHSLLRKRFSLTRFNKLCIGVSAAFSSYFLWLAFFRSNYLCGELEREIAKAHCLTLENKVMNSVAIYLLIILTVPALYNIFHTLRKEVMPKILCKQIKFFTLFFIIPFFCTEFLLALFTNETDSPHGRPLVAISTIFLVLAITYCLKKIMRLRFLNSTDSVEAKPNIEVIKNFKTVLHQLSNANHLHELGHITQTFFKEAFNLQTGSTSLMLCNEKEITHNNAIHAHICSFLNTQNSLIQRYIADHKILSFDELSFDQFYNEKPHITSIIQFLNKIKADIFIPIFIKNNPIGAIIIARESREHCFSKSERDAMLVFSNYLSNMVNLLQHKNLEQIISKEKRLKEELYQRHQEINQYKESINSFLRRSKQKSIGIIFYKNKQFIFGNKAAKELINININTQEGHPLAKACKHVAQQVETFKAPYTHFARDENGSMIILSGVPHLQRNHVIITVVYPEISDVISKKINQLRNPNDWDYVLYLESTQSGALINQIMPGSGETILNFKIDLLKAALSKRSLLLELSDEDARSIVEQLHYISLRETLYTLTLTNSTKTSDIARSLFGTHPLIQNEAQTPLLKLCDNGTLFIQNIQFLETSMQEQLADFIRYGYYYPTQSEQKIFSNARIMCSTNQDLSLLVQSGICSFSLYNAFKPIISMPSLSTIKESELFSLIDGFTDLALKTHTYKNVLALNNKEKDRLLSTNPTSLHELKIKVQQQLMKKSKESNMQSDAIFDPAYTISDPELAHVARLGKQALKDNKIMSLLWHKFKNQSKIAQFLGVNRSSVHRRYKMLQTMHFEKEKVA